MNWSRSRCHRKRFFGCAFPLSLCMRRCTVQWWLAGRGATEMEHPSYKYIHWVWWRAFMTSPRSSLPPTPSLLLPPLLLLFCHNTKRIYINLFGWVWFAAPWHCISFFSVLFIRSYSHSMMVMSAVLRCVRLCFVDCHTRVVVWRWDTHVCAAYGWVCARMCGIDECVWV